MWKNDSPRVPYIEGEILENQICTKFKEGITSEISPAQFPRKSSTVRSASLHKDTNEGVPRIPKRQERALGRWRGSSTHGGQDSMGRDIGPRTSKSSSLSEEPDSWILKGYCGAKEFGNPSLFHIEPKGHAEKEEMSEDERRMSKLPRDIVEDNPVLGQSKS